MGEHDALLSGTHDIIKKSKQGGYNIMEEQSEALTISAEEIEKAIEDGFKAFDEGKYEEAENIFKTANEGGLSALCLFGEGLARLYKDGLENVRAFTLKTNQALEVVESEEDAIRIITLAAKPDKDFNDKVNGMNPGTKKDVRAAYIVYVDNCMEFSYFMELEIENRKLLNNIDINYAYLDYIKSVLEYFRKVDRLPRVDRVRYKRDVNIFKLAQISLKENKCLPEVEEIHKATKELAETIEQERVSDDKKARRLMMVIVVVLVLLVIVVNSLIMNGLS